MLWVWMRQVRARALLRDDELALIFSYIEENEAFITVSVFTREW